MLNLQHASKSINGNVLLFFESCHCIVNNPLRGLMCVQLHVDSEVKKKSWLYVIQRKIKWLKAGATRESVEYL